MRDLLWLVVAAFFGCSCPDPCENSGLTLTLRQGDGASFGAVGDRLRIEVESSDAKWVTTCTMPPKGVATCTEGSTLRVSTRLAERDQVYELSVSLSPNPSRVTVTLRREDDLSVVAGPMSAAISYPTVSETCGCQGGAETTLHM